MSHTELLRRAADIARTDTDARWHPVATWLDQHANEHDVYDCGWEEQACGALKTARALLGET